MQQQYLDGAITNGERYNKVIAIWSDVTEKVAEQMFKALEQQDKEGVINPIYVMADSGARGSKQQIRQLSGMRGLMAKPSGEVIETPITSNFREGLTVLQYFISTHGARKGLADTALKTADSGYLTRRLVDVAQDVIINEIDCGTAEGIYVEPILEAGVEVEPLRDRVVGRVSLEKIKDYEGNLILEINQEITEELANPIQAAGIERVKIRSVLTCESRRGVCAQCYGRNLATGRMVELGEAVGVIAAQSIGEPGTQLTMRTFHIGGTATRIQEQSKVEARSSGFVRFLDLKVVHGRNNALIAMNRSGLIAIVDEKGREKERYHVVYGARLRVEEGQPVTIGQILAEWDPFTFSILTEVGGNIQFKDLQPGITIEEQVDEVTGLAQLVVTLPPGDEKHQPTILIRDSAGRARKKYLMPSRAHLMVSDGDEVQPGDVLAKIPRETTKTKDITGGLPRVVELFETRKPKDPAVISEIDGVVKYGEISKGLRKIYVESDDTKAGMTQKEYSIARGVHINVQEGEHVKAGEPLIDGPLNPHDLLAVLGEKYTQAYLVNSIQEVYRLQGVNINDKHIETIVRQMMRWVKVEDVGDTKFLLDEQVDKFRFREENDRDHQRRWASRHRPAAVARHHQGVALNRFVHLRGQLPGDHARTHRSGCCRQGGLPARPEGKRHHGPPDPGGHRPRALSEYRSARRGSATARHGTGDRHARPHTRRSCRARLPAQGCRRHRRKLNSGLPFRSETGLPLTRKAVFFVYTLNTPYSICNTPGRFDCSQSFRKHRLTRYGSNC